MYTEVVSVPVVIAFMGETGEPRPVKIYVERLVASTKSVNAHVELATSK